MACHIVVRAPSLVFVEACAAGDILKEISKVGILQHDTKVMASKKQLLHGTCVRVCVVV